MTFQRQFVHRQGYMHCSLRTHDPACFCLDPRRRLAAKQSLIQPPDRETNGRSQRQRCADVDYVDFQPVEVKDENELLLISVRLTAIDLYISQAERYHLQRTSPLHDPACSIAL
eukprot:m.84087 g.84087  ORF g.84087 m.84087 type:complete len:114 (-) comp14374_c0_seq3:106-447(-)